MDAGSIISAAGQSPGAGQSPAPHRQAAPAVPPAESATAFAAPGGVPETVAAPAPARPPGGRRRRIIIAAIVVAVIVIAIITILEIPHLFTVYRSPAGIGPWNALRRGMHG